MYVHKRSARERTLGQDVTQADVQIRQDATIQVTNNLGGDLFEGVASDDQLRPGGPSVHAQPSFPWVPVGVTTEAVSVQPK